VCVFAQLWTRRRTRRLPAAAQRGHFHLNGGPWVHSGVTLATVKTIVPAVCVCERERERKTNVCVSHRGKVWPPKPPKRNTICSCRNVTGRPTRRTCPESDGRLAPADTQQPSRSEASGVTSTPGPASRAAAARRPGHVARRLQVKRRVRLVNRTPPTDGCS